jgi:hypothetical protein
MVIIAAGEAAALAMSRLASSVVLSFGLIALIILPGWIPGWFSIHDSGETSVFLGISFGQSNIIRQNVYDLLRSFFK